MKKVKYLLKRILGMNYKNFFLIIDEVHKKTNKNKFMIFFDIIYCGLKYQAGYSDYNLFEMYKMNKHERSTIITRGINNEFIKKYNDQKYIKYLNNKLEFNKYFNDYLNRDWLELKEDNFNEFKEFCNKHSKIVAKPIDAACGVGIEIIEVNSKNMKKTYNKLLNNKQFLIEEVAIQCDELKKIHPDSVNTIRVVTLLGKVVVAFLRIGNNHNVVDNFNHDGMAAPIDVKTGTIKYKAIDKKKKLYEKHPITNENIVGIKIPKWNMVKKLCEEASTKIPQVGYIGWDVCIGENKCFFIEGNEFPGHDIYQLPPHRDSNIGLLPLFREVEKNKEDK